MKTVDKSLTGDLKWLVQEVNGSIFQHARSHGVVGIGRHEDDWYVKTKMAQMLLELDTGHVGHLDVQYQALRFRHR